MNNTPAPPPRDGADSWLVTYNALESLVDMGLSKGGILQLSRLGAAGAHRLNEALQLVDGVPQKDLSKLIDAITEKKGEPAGGAATERVPAAPGPVPRLPPSPIDRDGNNASTATGAHLLPPPTTPRTSTSRTRSASLSTDLTHPSQSSKRLKVTPPHPKPPRPVRYCPHCLKVIKNAFERHFRSHVKGLLGADISDMELIGCGYCECADAGVDNGKAFKGEADFLDHLKQHHTQPNHSSPVSLQWDFNTSFKNTLAGENNFARKYRELLSEAAKDAAKDGCVPPILSWPSSDETKTLLSRIQIHGGKIYNVEPHVIDKDDTELKDSLVEEAYSIAHKRQPPQNAQPTPPSERTLPMTSSQRVLRRQPRKDPLFSRMGGGAYAVADSSFGEASSPFSPATPNHRDEFSQNQPVYPKQSVPPTPTPPQQQQQQAYGHPPQFSYPPSSPQDAGHSPVYMNYFNQQLSEQPQHIQQQTQGNLPQSPYTQLQTPQYAQLSPMYHPSQTIPQQQQPQEFSPHQSYANQLAMRQQHHLNNTTPQAPLRFSPPPPPQSPPRNAVAEHDQMYNIADNRRSLDFTSEELEWALQAIMGPH